MSAPAAVNNESTPIYDQVLATVGLADPVDTEYEVLAAEAVLQLAAAKAGT